MDLLVKWMVLSGVLFAAAAALPTVRIRSFGAAVFGAAVFGVLNVLFGWLLKAVAGLILFIPKVLTLGLLGLLVPIVVNMVLLKLAEDATDEDIQIEGIPALFTMATVVSLTSYIAF